MPNTIEPKPGLFSGLAKLLHLHQLPQAPGQANLPAPARNATPGEIPPIRATMTPPRNASSSEKAQLSPIPPTQGKSSPSNDAKKNSPLSSNKTIAPVTISLPPREVSNKSPSTPRWPTTTHSAPTTPATKGMIITDYDRILELVKTHHPVKLDEIARVLSMKEEQVAQELQTLEDNGLVEVKYPAFGEPLIYYKPPEA